MDDKFVWVGRDSTGTIVAMSVEREGEHYAEFVRQWPGGDRVPLAWANNNGNGRLGTTDQYGG